MKNDSVRVRRLGWAGVEIDCAGQTLLIDYVQDTTPLPQLRGPNEPFPPSSRPGAAVGALLTHLHADHADPSALTIGLREGAPVLRPEPATGSLADRALTAHAEEQFIHYPLRTDVVGTGVERQVGPFTIWSVPAVDGFGDPQLSWIVECAGRRIFHGGDTIFHGFWWRIAHQFGPLHVAFLPINGAVVNFPLLQPANPLAAVMTPEQAAVAARMLGARWVVPIHYGSLHKPPMYTETSHPVEHFKAKAEELGVEGMILEPGEWFDVE